MSSSNFFTALVSLVVIWCQLMPAVGLQCPGCGDKRDCPSVVDCLGGTVPDPCGCCLECARVTNQTCGGRYRSEGKCDEGLVCVITPHPGAIITGEEVGTCRGTTLYCISAVTLSVPVLGMHQECAGGATVKFLVYQSDSPRRPSADKQSH